MPDVRVAETFSSIQGEGIWSGVPSFFIRLSGCNLRCVWCDTPYASWSPEGPIRSVESLLEEAAASPDRHVVITGGEPMLFDAIEPLCAGLKERGKTITIETAGTVMRDLPCDLMSISPKLANSAPPVDTAGGWHERHERIRNERSPLRDLLNHYIVQLKFVVNPDDGLQDLEEIDALLRDLPPVEPDRILLMPEGTDRETLSCRLRLLADVCRARQWRLCPRLHVDLYGDTRGT